MYIMSLFSTFLWLKLYIRGKIVMKTEKKPQQNRKKKPNPPPQNWKKAKKENNRYDKD